jgi:hypothetical protein
LEWVKNGEISSTEAPVKRGEVARICIRAMGLTALIIRIFPIT